MKAGKIGKQNIQQQKKEREREEEEEGEEEEGEEEDRKHSPCVGSCVVSETPEERKERRERSDFVYSFCPAFPYSYG